MVPRAHAPGETDELGGTSMSLFMYVDDVDAVVKQAVDAGGSTTMEVADQLWGDRFRHGHRPVRPCVVDRDALLH